MARERTTLDVWEIHVNYGEGWENECGNFSIWAHREDLKAYRENCKYPFKTVKKREKKSNYTAHQLAMIENEIAAARTAYLERCKAKREAKAKQAAAALGARQEDHIRMQMLIYPAN